MEKLGEELGFKVRGLASVGLDGRIVSSTRIRETIQAGRLNEVDQMLGREYVLTAPVVAGDKVGRQLGYPTANLNVTGLVTPPSGVYAVHVTVDGIRHRAALSIGYRPTLKIPTPHLMVEAYLLDFEGDLYGKQLQVTFVRKIRDQIKLPTLEDLSRQIAADVASIRQIFNTSTGSRKAD